MERAVELGFAAVALTDHDTLDGLPEAQVAADRLGLGFLPGVEISAAYRGAEIHVAGLGISAGCQSLSATLAELADERFARAEEIIRRLNEAGIPIDREKVLGNFAADGGDRRGSVDRCDRNDSCGRNLRCGSIGRLHIAREIHALGHAKTVQDAFNRYIGQGRVAFVEKRRLTCEEAIDLVHEAGGLAILCHPGIGKLGKRLKRVLDFPFDGLEVYHTKHTPDHVEHFTRLATERGLLISGGSDCHGAGTATGPEMGKVRVPYEHYQRILAALNPHH